MSSGVRAPSGVVRSARSSATPAASCAARTSLGLTTGGSWWKSPVGAGGCRAGI